MRTLRHRPTLTLMALLAFALQAVVAFSHTHSHVPGSFAAAQVKSQVRTVAARAMTYGHCRTAAPCTAPAHDQNHDERNCPVCWSASLASAALLGAPPALELPDAARGAPAPQPVAPQCCEARSALFQARAPPIVAA
jgi:hypothetical protein